MAKKDKKEKVKEPKSLLSNERIKVIEDRIEKAFDLFDTTGSKTCSGIPNPLQTHHTAEKIGDIFRALNIHPSLEQLQAWKTNLMITEKEQVLYQNFLKLAFQILSEETIHPFNPVFIQNSAEVNEERLKAIYFRGFDYKLVERAFKVLDQDEKGYLTVDELTRLLTSQGESLTKDEMDDMIGAMTNTDGKIFTDDYIQLLAQV